VTVFSSTPLKNQFQVLNQKAAVNINEEIKRLFLYLDENKLKLHIFDTNIE